jgi:hypothetical protein
MNQKSIYFFPWVVHYFTLSEGNPNKIIMVNLTIGEPGAIWQQLANAFFLSAGLFNDLLCVRTSLTMSYVFLFITGWMGAPRWSDSFNPTGFVSVDTIVWAVLNLFVHFNSVMR